MELPAVQTEFLKLLALMAAACLWGVFGGKYLAVETKIGTKGGILNAVWITTGATKKPLDNFIWGLLGVILIVAVVVIIMSETGVIDKIISILFIIPGLFFISQAAVLTSASFSNKQSG